MGELRSRQTAPRPVAARQGFVWLLPMAIVAGLVTIAPRQVTGDAVEYITYTANLAHLQPPSPTRADVESVRALLREHGSRAADNVLRPPLRGADGRHALSHFWLYSALVVPAWWLLAPLGAHPVLPFAVVNLALLALAARVLWRRLRAPWALLLIAGPILWWVDKAQVEVFVFALGVMAFAYMEERPGLALVLTGAVAAQFPPFALVLAVLPLLLLLRRGRLSRATLAGLAAGVLLAAAHPAYFLWRVGALGPLPRIGREFRVPETLESLGTVLWDPNIGMLANVPMVVAGLLLAAGAVAAHRGIRGLPGSSGIVALITLPVLLLSFTVPNNFDHGGTPGMSRYALVLLVLAVPLVRAAGALDGRRLRYLPWAVSVAAVAWSLVFFRPAVPEQRHVPTRLAAALWTYAPWLHDPLPEIFAERVQRTEKPRYPAATHNCTKVLLRGGNWPVPCVPSGDLPTECARPGALCYANWSGSGYRIRLAAESTGTFGYFRNERSWPLAQASLPLAAWSLAERGLECDEIGQRLGILAAKCRHALRPLQRRGLRGSRVMRGTLSAHRRPFARMLRRGDGPEDAYVAAAALPGAAASPWLTRFVEIGEPERLQRLAVGDLEGRIQGVRGAPWTVSLEDARRLLLYVPARDTPARVDLRLGDTWSGALVHADDGSEKRRIAWSPAAGGPAGRHRGADTPPDLTVAPSRRDLVLVLFPGRS